MIVLAFAVIILAIWAIVATLSAIEANDRAGQEYLRAERAVEFAEECLAELGNVRPVVIDFEGGVVMVGPVAHD